MSNTEADPQRWIVRVPVRVLWGMQDTALLASLLEGLVELCADLRNRMRH